jgi:predicted nucleic acid-binding protein
VTETPAEVVVDASAVVRGLTTEGPAARLLDEIAEGVMVGHSPDLVVAEVSSALAISVRVEARALEDAQMLFGSFVATPIVLHEATPLAPAAIELAATTQLSAYDALYAVLAGLLDLALATADRRLAEAVAHAVFVG